ncbi:hypothetical protein OSTOST_08268, partial [Ostertagia ostertagi]
ESDLREIHQDLVNCCNCTEREIEVQERLRTEQLNEICQLSARISELTDHVEKARLRESELAEEGGKMGGISKRRKAKAIISDDIEYNINMLMQMRTRVDNKLVEIKQRKREHKHHLKQMKNEMLLMHQELGEWDRKYDELCEMIKRMEVTRRQLQERIKEQQQRETTAKARAAKRCTSNYSSPALKLDKKLHDLYGSIGENEDGTLKVSVDF